MTKFLLGNVKGPAGATPSITATATVGANVGTPTVTVTKGGTDANPTLAFAFDGIKGSDGGYTLPAATSTTLGGVKTGSNITNSSGTISVTKSNVTSALGYTPAPSTAMGAATSSTAGATGLVPAPAAGKQLSYLRGDGTWQVPTNTTYSAATTSAAGLMSAADKTKLDGIQVSADAVSFTRSLASGTQVGTITINGSSTTLYCEKNTDTTYAAATESTDGLMSAADKAKLDGVLDLVYPVGSIYLSYVSTSPASLFGGSWTQITGRFLRAANDVSTGGSDTWQPHLSDMGIHTYAYDYGAYTEYGAVNEGAFVFRTLTYQKTGNDKYADYAKDMPWVTTIDKRPAYQDVYAWRRVS